ncbi:MAG: hypothetical protein U1E65_16225 [Myxococcota bacterium]
MNVRKLALVVSLYAAPLLILPVATPAHATASAKKKKAKTPKTSAKTKSREAEETAAAPAPTPSSHKIEKVTASNIAKWVKRGDSETDIIARADAAGYTVTGKDEKILKKAKVPTTLIASLKGESAPPSTVAAAETPRSEPKAEPVKKTESAKKSPQDDFDSTPPPPGTPAWVEQKAKEEKKAQAAASPELPKKSEHAGRPSAPTLEETHAAPVAPTEGGVRRPLIPKDS